MFAGRIEVVLAPGMTVPGATALELENHAYDTDPSPPKTAAETAVVGASKHSFCVVKGCVEIIGSATFTISLTAELTASQPEPESVISA